MKAQRNSLLDGVLKTLQIGALVALGSVLVPPAILADEFADYWYRGEAELTSYALEQARYGEIHPGHAVLIFVTEDFSRSKQVKLDRPQDAGEDRVPILKLNATRKFNTGIYPYSMMSSVFSPIAADHRALKVTVSSQEWCGHTFSQINQRGDGYQVQQMSYFESEGDQELEVQARLEDELWTTVRLDPESLPIGDFEMVPGTMYLRLSHAPIAAYRATARLEAMEEEGLMAYSLTYPKLGRVLEVHFRKAFPHEIEGWRETYRSGFGPKARELTTRATRMQRMMSPYWQQHDLADVHLRQKLGLE